MKKTKQTPKKVVEERTKELARIDSLEAEILDLRIAVAEAFEFGANELRPLFGQGSLALVFDGIAKGLRKKLETKK